MPRYFAPITKNQLMDKIDECEDRIWKSLSPQVSDDLKKVEFDTENESCSPSDAWGWKNKKDNLLGYRALDNGLTFIGVNAGGDWETPIFFIIYWDGKKLRAYIPEKGNTWNTISKSAMGNDEESDAKFLAKLFPKEYAERESDHGKDEYWKQMFVDCYKHNILLDKDLLEGDIKARILPQPCSSTVSKKTDKPKTKPLIDDTTLDLEKGDIGEIIESLTFYSCGDEAYELWSSLCSTCYSLVSLGHDDRARILLKWIVEDAKESREWSIEQYGSLDNTDSKKGRWGY